MSPCRLAPLLAIAAVMLGTFGPGGLQQARAQKLGPTKSIDPSGRERNLPPRTIVYVGGSGPWDKAYDPRVDAFKKLDAYREGAGPKAAGPAMTIYTSTDDTGFDFKA